MRVRNTKRTIKIIIMSIYKNLLEAKKEMEAITKDSKNPFFKSMYFDINKLLSEVEPILQKHNLLLLQPIEAEFVKTIIYDIETEKSVSSEIHLPDIKDPQKLGSAITYYRRYTLQSLLGLQAEDDDANSISNNVNANKEDDKKWLNKYDTDKETISRDWIRAEATVKTNQEEGIKKLQSLFKISKDNLKELKKWIVTK